MYLRFHKHIIIFCLFPMLSTKVIVTLSFIILTCRWLLLGAFWPHQTTNKEMLLYFLICNSYNKTYRNLFSFFLNVAAIFDNEFFCLNLNNLRVCVCLCLNIMQYFSQNTFHDMWIKNKQIPYTFGLEFKSIAFIQLVLFFHKNQFHMTCKKWEFKQSCKGKLLL